MIAPESFDAQTKRCSAQIENATQPQVIAMSAHVLSALINVVPICNLLSCFGGAHRMPPNTIQTIVSFPSKKRCAQSGRFFALQYLSDYS